LKESFDSPSFASHSAVVERMLDITGLLKRFRTPDGETLVIVDIAELSVAEGEQVALRGASGSGKTTLLHLIAGLLQADHGRITIAGEEVTAMSESARDRARARLLGYVFQSFNLLQGYTALENVMLGMLFGKGVDRSRAVQLLERVGLGHRLHYRPAQLSIGQQQRVAVARALANRPRLVLADEPTGNLDQRHAGEALSLIRDVCTEYEAALLLVSHDQHVLAAFERVVDLATINRAVDAHSRAGDTPADGMPAA
jgi:putative ABC transport system ATP-binding protein